MDVREIPLDVRVRLAHACCQRIAEIAEVDLLHLKGPTLDADLRRERVSTDADVLVRPEHVPRFVEALSERGWRAISRFERGSPFGHAANFRHPHWGLLDVHRHWPGFEVSPASAFEVLWAERGSAHLAGVPCAVGSRPAQVLMLALHAARGGPGDPAREDLAGGWYAASDSDRDGARTLARRLDAGLALAIVLGEEPPAGLDTRTAPLWRYYAEGGTRREEWRARWRAARGGRERFAVLRALATPDLDHLESSLGRRPRGGDIARHTLRRVGRGLGVRGRS